MHEPEERAEREHHHASETDHVEDAEEGVETGDSSAEASLNSSDEGESVEASAEETEVMFRVNNLKKKYDNIRMNRCLYSQSQYNNIALTIYITYDNIKGIVFLR